jgi:ATP-dependent DNA helicase RecQ
MLKDLRKSITKKLNIPPFVLFHDTSLEDMATQYPITIDELKSCQGVGEGKAKKYGQEFVELIAKYVEEREIERPQDMVVKSMGYKAGAKVFVIQSIDHKLPLEEIAHSKNVDMDELLTEIEAIVSYGTKLNIDYYIDEVMDEDKRDEIYDYFRNEAKSESIEDAIQELDGNYTEDEVRLVRIKFMSEFN